MATLRLGTAIKRQTHASIRVQGIELKLNEFRERGDGVGVIKQMMKIEEERIKAIDLQKRIDVLQKEHDDAKETRERIKDEKINLKIANLQIQKEEKVKINPVNILKYKQELVELSKQYQKLVILLVKDPNNEQLKKIITELETVKQRIVDKLLNNL